jgi:N-acyl-D-amino-acid deacylase
MYLYTAGATGLTASLPPWVQEGGFDVMLERLRRPEVRRRVEAEMIRAGGWENLLLSAGDASRVLIVGVDREELKPLLGRTLAEVAEERDQSPQATVIDLILEDETRVEAVYFLMSEENLVRQIQLPYMAFGSDAGAMAPRPPFTNQGAHPRAYGNFARLLGRYVREQQVIPLEEAVRRLTSMPSQRLGLRDRGVLRSGTFADVVVFDPAEIADRASFEDPHQLAVGVRHVFVNGRPALLDGSATEERPGRVVRGPGWLGWDGTDATTRSDVGAGTEP